MIDRDKVEQALRRIAYLRDNISSDSVDYELIDETMADVEKGLSKPEALAVAERTGTVITSKSRKEVVAEIRRMLRGLKKSYERNSGRERSIETVPALAQ